MASACLRPPQKGPPHSGSAARGGTRQQKEGEKEIIEKQEIKALSTNDAEEGRGKDNGSKQQEHKGEDEKTTGQETKNMGKGKR